MIVIQARATWRALNNCAGSGLLDPQTGNRY
jgi:hypothetical protein